MRLDSFRFLVGPLVLVLAVAGSAAAQETSLVGTWALDLKASTNVPESQKGVDLTIALSGREMTITRAIGEKVVGEPLVLTLDGVGRAQNLSGQRANVTAKWLAPEKKFELVVSMPQAGSTFLMVQTVVTEISPTGGTMSRNYLTRKGPEREDRLLVYRRR